MVRRRDQVVKLGVLEFRRRIWRLVSQPIFIALTIFGNMVIIIGASSLFYLEVGVNPDIQSFLDTLWWAMSTVTTVGYGDVTPITQAGRVVGIFLMIVGTACFWSYTALFAEAVISKDIMDLEDELRSVERLLNRLEREKAGDQRGVSESLRALNEQISKMLHSK